MKSHRRLSGFRKFQLLALGFVLLGMTGESCTEERTIDIVVGVDLTATIPAVGEDNTYDESTTLFLTDEIDIEEILDDNGLDNIKSLTVQSAFVRVIQKDPAEDRAITGEVSLQYPAGTGPAGQLLDQQGVLVNSAPYENWVAVPLEAPGVALLNEALQDLIDGQVTPGMGITFRSQGTSTPTDQRTNFVYEVLVRLNAVGQVTVDIIEPPL